MPRPHPEPGFPRPYPVRRGLTAAMREALGRPAISPDAGLAKQATSFARAEPSDKLVQRLWAEAEAVLQTRR